MSTEVPIRAGQLWESETAVRRRAWIRQVGPTHVRTYLPLTGTVSRITPENLRRRYVMIQDIARPEHPNPENVPETPAMYARAAAALLGTRVEDLNRSVEFTFVLPMVAPITRILLYDAGMMEYRTWESIDKSWRPAHLAFSILGRPPLGNEAAWAKFAAFISTRGDRV